LLIIKNPCKTEGGRREGRGGQVVREALGGGGARGKSKLEGKQKPDGRGTGVGCRGGER